MPISKKLSRELASPKSNRIWWATIDKQSSRRAIKRLISSDHPPSLWPKPEEVKCWCYEGKPWEYTTAQYPK